MYFLDVMCEPLLPFIRLVKNGLIPVIQIGIPIVLIVIGMFDLGKAVVASKEDEIKSAQKLLIKRVIYAILIFFVVFLVTAVFNIVAGSGNGDQGTAKWSECWNDSRL